MYYQGHLILIMFLHVGESIFLFLLLTIMPICYFASYFLCRVNVFHRYRAPEILLRSPSYTMASGIVNFSWCSSKQNMVIFLFLTSNISWHKKNHYFIYSFHVIIHSIYENLNAYADMWSVGAILAELFMSSPLFPGERYLCKIPVAVFLFFSAKLLIQ